MGSCRILAASVRSSTAAGRARTSLTNWPGFRASNSSAVMRRCQLFIFPVAVGAGKRLFTGDAGMTAFRLTQATTTSTGVAILTYEPARA